MVNIRIKDHQKAPCSPRADVGEIDTRAPFQSVKAAVTLFREVALPKEKPPVKKPKLSSENVLAKETQLLLAQKELNRTKQQLETLETTKARALVELQRAKGTLQDLTTKLKAVSESKQMVVEATSSMKNQAKKSEAVKSRNGIGCQAWKEEVEHARKVYMATVTELDAAKQVLTKFRQDFDATLEAKQAAFQQAAEVQRSANVNTERVNELTKEIAAMQLSIENLKLSTLQAQQEREKIVAEKDACLQSYKSAKEEADKKLCSVKKELGSESTATLEARFAETTLEIEVVQVEMRKTHTSGMDTVRVVTSELKGAIETLQEVAEEESSLRSLVSSLRMELERVKNEHADWKEKIVAEEYIAANLNTELQDFKEEVELEEKDSDVSDDEPQQLMSEAEEMKRNANELKKEAEAARMATEEGVKKLELALREAEEAKAAEQRALSEMKILSGKQETLNSSNSQPAAKIKTTVDEVESLKRKIEESRYSAESKEQATMAQLETIKAIKNDADRKSEAKLTAIEGIRIATLMALKKADMAGSAERVVESELQRWRQEEQKVESEAASTVQEHTGKSSGSFSPAVIPPERSG